MNRQQRKTIHTDMNRTMISLQHHNLILRPNLKPKTTSHSQNRHTRTSTIGLNSSLSIEDLTHNRVLSLEEIDLLHSNSMISFSKSLHPRASTGSQVLFVIGLTEDPVI